MPERERRQGEVVRAALFREQPKPEKVGHNAWQTFLVQRPTWSNLGRHEWQIVGSSEVYADESKKQAVQRAVQRETGLQNLSFKEVGEYQNGQWLTYLFVAMLEPQLAASMVIDFDSNQGAKWFDVSVTRGVVVDEANEKRLPVALNEVAFDHNQMIMDAAQVQSRGE